MLEIHSFAPVSGYGRPELPLGLRCVTFRDGIGHLVSQVYANGSDNARRRLQDTEPVPFFIDGRRIVEEKLARQVMHLLHKLHAFSPSVGEIVVWTHDVPERLFDFLDESEVNFYVDEVRGVGLVITISASEIQRERETATRKSAL